jgi:molybdate transport system regulatory protein
MPAIPGEDINSLSVIQTTERHDPSRQSIVTIILMPDSHKSVSLHPRFRIYSGKEIAIGPGKADLLIAIERTGSIQKGAKSLKMSYMRAWKLIRTMNECFRSPLVQAVRGGKTKGGARLTQLGKKILALYLDLEKTSLRATSSIYKKIAKEIK